MPDHDGYKGKHRDPLNRKRPYLQTPDPEVEGVPLSRKKAVPNPKDKNKEDGEGRT